MASETMNDDISRGHLPQGVLYLISGVVLLLFSVACMFRTIGFDNHPMRVLNVPPDIIGGAILFLSGSLFLAGGSKTLRGKRDGIAFVWIGWMVGALLSAVSTLILLSNAFSSKLIQVDDMKDWSVYDDIVPALYIGILLIIILPVLLRRSRISRSESFGGDNGP